MIMRYLISGYVQGVGFRWYVNRKAGLLGLKGIVRNIGNGDVEVIAVGDENTLNQLESLLRDGPAFSSVADVKKERLEETENKYFDFSIVR